MSRPLTKDENQNRSSINAFCMPISHIQPFHRFTFGVALVCKLRRRFEFRQSSQVVGESEWRAELGGTASRLLNIRVAWQVAYRLQFFCYWRLIHPLIQFFISPLKY